MARLHRCMFNFIGQLIFSKMIYHFTFLLAMCKSSSCPTFFFVFFLSHILNLQWWLIVVLIFLFLMTDYVELFSCAYLPFIYLLCFKSFAVFFFKIEVIFFFIELQFLKILQKYKIFVRYMFCISFLLVCGLPFNIRSFLSSQCFKS